MRKAVLMIALVLLCSSNALGYEKDIHFHMTYYLARCAGFNQDLARIIASTAEYVDENGSTWPGSWHITTGAGREILRLYHFPVWDSKSPPFTERNSTNGRYNNSKAILEAFSLDQDTHDNSLFKFGVSTHVLEDSFAHEGYGYFLGHIIDMHTPDKPYLHRDKTLETAALLYSRLIDFYRAYNGEEPKPTIPWSKVRAFLDPVVKRAYQNDDYDKELQQRCEYWQAQIKNAGLGDESHDASKYQTMHGKEFEQAIGKNCLPHQYLTSRSPGQPSQTRPGATMMKLSPETILPIAQYCNDAMVLTGKPQDVVDHLLDDAPWLITADCVKALVADQAGLGRLMERLSDGAPIYTVLDLMDRSGASKELKQEVVEPYLRSEQLTTRLVAANILYHLDPTSQSAMAVYEDAFRQAKKTGLRLMPVNLIPHSDSFFYFLQHYLESGYDDQKPIAASGLYDIGNKQSYKALQDYASKQKLNGPALGLTYWLIMGYEKKDDILSPSENEANQQKLIQLVQKSLKKPDILKPAVTALHTHSGHKQEAARCLIDALDVSDLNVRWHVGYALVVISGQDFDLTARGMEEIKAQAEEWYKKEFPS